MEPERWKTNVPAPDCCQQHVAATAAPPAVATPAAVAAAWLKSECPHGDVTSAISSSSSSFSRPSERWAKYKIQKKYENQNKLHEIKTKPSRQKEKCRRGHEAVAVAGAVVRAGGGGSGIGDWDLGHGENRVERTLLHSTLRQRQLWERQCAGSTGVEVERNEWAGRGVQQRRGYQEEGRWLNATSCDFGLHCLPHSHVVVN